MSLEFTCIICTQTKIANSDETHNFDGQVVMRTSC